MKNTFAKTQLEELGFQIEETGGRCQAFVKRLGEGLKIMITNWSGCSLPTETEISVGLVKESDDGCEDLSVEDLGSLQEMLDHIATLEAPEAMLTGEDFLDEEEYSDDSAQYSDYDAEYFMDREPMSEREWESMNESNQARAEDHQRDE